MLEILSHSIDAYFKNIKLILFFSTPFLLAFLITLFSPIPNFNAAGGVFLRFGSIQTDLTPIDIAIILFCFFTSLFLFSFAVVAINIVIKSQRTLTNIRADVIEGIEKYTLNVFLLFLMAQILILVVNLIFFEYNLHKIWGAFFAFLVFLPLFFAPAGMVIDELSVFRAMEMSLRVIKLRFGYFILWIALGFFALSLADFLLLATFQNAHNIAESMVLFLNSLFILPFLVVLQTQIYLSKYTILK